MPQRTSLKKNRNITLSGTVTLKESVGVTKDYKINNAIITQLLQQQNKSDLTYNPDEIEEMLLEMPTLKCTVDNDDNRILKIDPQNQQYSEDDRSLDLMLQELPL